MTDDKLLILRALSTLRQVRDAKLPELALLPSFHELIDDLVTRLEKHEPVLVTPYEFVKQVEGKENVRGIPVVMSVWPMQEWGDSQSRFTEG